MTCSRPARTNCVQLCTQVNYPYRRIAASSGVTASKPRSCTLGGMKLDFPIEQTLSFEPNMDLISLNEFMTLVPVNAKFGTYVDKKKGGHFCVDAARKTVDGRRLAWLWIFGNGQPMGAHKLIPDPPTLIWTKQNIIDAYNGAADATLPMFTRHVDTYPELAITFCLPYP